MSDELKRECAVAVWLAVPFAVAMLAVRWSRFRSQWRDLGVAPFESIFDVAYFLAASFAFGLFAVVVIQVGSDFLWTYLQSAEWPARTVGSEFTLNAPQTDMAGWNAIVAGVLNTSIVVALAFIGFLLRPCMRAM